MFHPHHLELFYYVAKYGGISAAARHIPYGIGQPAISGQIADLEHQLGTQLFQRRPFALTPPGRRLFAHIGPCFDRLPHLWEELRGTLGRRLSLAADASLEAEFLPALCVAVAPLYPELRVELRVGPPSQVAAWLQDRQVHFAITCADHSLRGIRRQVLASPCLRLVVQKNTPPRICQCPWVAGRLAAPLICPEEGSALCQSLDHGLRALHIDRPTTIRVDSLNVMLSLVAQGLGLGICLAAPRCPAAKTIRTVPLRGFERVPVVARWDPSVGACLPILLTTAASVAKRLWPEP